MKHLSGGRRRIAAGAALATVAALALAGCAGSSSSGSSDAPKDGFGAVEAALEKGGEITYWSWTPSAKAQVAAFEKAYPKVKVNLVNAGTGNDEYTKLQNAIKAGSGAPDVVQVEYYAFPQFVLSNALLDLAPYGFSDLESDYTASTWASVTAGEKIYGLPQDSGPMGNLYREDIMTAAGVTEPPATWADYKTAAEKVRAKTDSYISNMAPGQGAGWLGLLWQAGIKPFGYDGDKGVTINVNSPEAKKVMAYWQDMIQNDLVSVDPDFNDEWYQGLNQGKYAGWLTAAWAPVFLSGAAKDTSGLWRAAPLPQWDTSKPASGNQGGSADAVLKTTKNPIAAYELAKWINNAQEPALLFTTQQNFFPTAISVLEDPVFVDQKSDFYGGQEVNKLFADISTTVDTDWQWLPFMEFAYSSFNETFGAAVAAKGDLAAGLDAWQDALVDYAKQQGFTVNG